MAYPSDKAGLLMSELAAQEKTEKQNNAGNEALADPPPPYSEELYHRISSSEEPIETNRAHLAWFDRLLNSVPTATKPRTALHKSSAESKSPQNPTQLNPAKASKQNKATRESSSKTEKHTKSLPVLFTKPDEPLRYLKPNPCSIRCRCGVSRDTTIYFPDLPNDSVRCTCGYIVKSDGSSRFPDIEVDLCFSLITLSAAITMWDLNPYFSDAADNNLMRHLSQRVLRSEWIPVNKEVQFSPERKLKEWRGVKEFENLDCQFGYIKRCTLSVRLQRGPIRWQTLCVGDKLKILAVIPGEVWISRILKRTRMFMLLALTYDCNLVMVPNVAGLIKYLYAKDLSCPGSERCDCCTARQPCGFGADCTCCSRKGHNWYLQGCCEDCEVFGRSSASKTCSSEQQVAAARCPETEDRVVGQIKDALEGVSKGCRAAIQDQVKSQLSSAQSS